MIMANTIEKAVYPLLLTASVLGLGVYSPKKPYLSILYNITVWIAYGCLYYYTVTTLKAEIWFQSISTMLYIQTGILAIITSIIMSVYQDKRFRIFMKRLAAVDDTLKELGTPEIYRQLHKYSKRVLIGWFVCTHMANSFDTIWWFYAMKDHRCIIIPYITNHFHHVHMLENLLFITLLWYIGTRFDKVNEHMRCLLIKKEYGLRYAWRKPVLTTRGCITDKYKCILWTSMHVHLELCQIARELNVMFGPQLTMEIVAYLIYLTISCDYIIKHVQTKSHYIFSPFTWIDIYFWIFLHVAGLFCLNYVCENVSTKANEMEKIIHQLTDFLRYADVRDEIYQFSLQIIYHPLKFTGLGLFYFGNGLLRKFFMTITTFLIFIIQMVPIPKKATDF
ncbi:unnamed protein product [Lasius platythorax]|uniref:Gustatory receptor n=1 Tax=Lasius platythorax TaxID=488582 RepID=A0AAV2NAI2_9HYME